MDLMSVCRTCMSSSSLNAIFPLLEAHDLFSKAIFRITGLKIKLNDGLSQKMCIECLKQINDVLKFKAKCKETEETLMKIKHEVRRAVRHNQTIDGSGRDIIKEIKVENRWVKIDHPPTITYVDDDDDEDDYDDDEEEEDDNNDEEQAIMQLLNTQTNNNIQNIYIANEADGQVIPLEMLKVEIDSTKFNATNYKEAAEENMNDQEQTNNEPEYVINNPEDVANNQENYVNDPDYLIDNPEDSTNDQENAVDEPQYIINIQGNVTDQPVTVNEQQLTVSNSDTIIKSEHTIINQEDTVNDPEDTFNDPEVSDSLKTYYILKDNASYPDTAELIKTETDSIDNPEFDNINISKNQDIIVMDNKESLYVIDMSNPASKRVTCKLCQKNLSIRSIDLHLSKSHPGADGRRVKCQLCDNFVIKEKMVQHRLVMHGAEAFQCRYCKWEFEKEDALIEHVVNCTAKKKRKACDSVRELVECGVCHKTMQKASLRLHTAMTHAGLRPVCDHCGKSFGNKFRLSEHCRAKHGYEKFKCSYCDFQSASSLALTNHERRHRGEKPYICDRCGAKFHAAYLLAQHRQSHRTERKYKCEICAMSFKTNNGLHSHRRVCHYGVRRMRIRALHDITDAPTEINDV